MVFSSVTFLFFFLPLSLAVHFLLPRMLRNLWLVLTSILFYWWGEREFAWVLIASIGINYFFGIVADRLKDPKSARWSIAIAIILNLSLLIYFKYADFLVANASLLWERFGGEPLKPPRIHLPIGISFFTFQALSYLIDIYRKKQKPLNRLDALGLYISSFPQLIAGPIIRYNDVKDQLLSRIITPEKFSLGIRRFIAGLGKKILIANTLALAADGIFEIPSPSLTPTLAWVGIVSYTLQIYYDFSGYSDMAIGLGHMFGFTFMENFNYPYIATSIREFWRRWHISLSNWFRDYLYFPLGGNRKGGYRTALNLFVVFTLCGLWHGASWNFLFWGIFHGLFLVLERGIHLKGTGIGKRILSHVYVLLVVMVGWIFFRTDTLSDAGSYLKAMAGLTNANNAGYPWQIYISRETVFALICAIIGAMPWIRRLRETYRNLGIQRTGRMNLRLIPIANIQETLILIIIYFCCAVKLSGGTYNPFIYFRF